MIGRKTYGAGHVYIDHRYSHGAWLSHGQERIPLPPCHIFSLQNTLYGQSHTSRMPFVQLNTHQTEISVNSVYKYSYPLLGHPEI